MAKPTKMNHSKFVDFTKRYWGHDFQLLNKLDRDGYKWEISCHYPERPIEDQYILLKLDHNDIRVAQIKKVKAFGNPRDHYLLDIEIKHGNTARFISQFPHMKEVLKCEK